MMTDLKLNQKVVISKDAPHHAYSEAYFQFISDGAAVLTKQPLTTNNKSGTYIVVDACFVSPINDQSTDPVARSNNEC